MFVSIKPCYALRIQRLRGNACHSANSADYFVEVACKTQNRCHIKNSFKTDGRNASCGLRVGDACRRHHWSVRRVTPGWRRVRRHSVLRMPAFFLLSAEFNPDYDDNHDDCNQNAHLVFTSLPQGGRGSVATSDTLGTLPSARLI